MIVFSLILPLLCYVPFSFEKTLAENLFLAVFYLFSFFIVSTRKKIRPFMKVFLLIIGVVFYFIIFEKIRSLEGGVFFISFLSILKLWELKEVRDYYLLILILILSLIGHMLNVDSLYFLFYAMSLLLFMFYSMVAVRFHGRFRAIDLKRLNNYFFYAIGPTLVLFFLFPRFKIYTFNVLDSSAVARSGFSEELNPGSISRLIQSDEVVFRARFLGSFPPIPEIYWRGMSFDINKGLNWEKGKLLVENFDYSKELVYDYIIDYENKSYGPLFTLGHYDQIQLLSSGRLQKTSAGAYSIYPYGRDKIRYKGKEFKVEFSSLRSEARNRFLQTPKTDQKLKLFIESNIKKKTDLDSINAFFKYLSDNNFLYSTAPGEMNNLSEFFFEQKRGFCEHFAALMAYSLRVMGIPSRIISGYQGGEYNAIGDYFIIREKDAHAWVEAWIEGRGWVRFDPVNAVAPDRLRIGASQYYENIFSNDKNFFMKVLTDLGLSEAVLVLDSLFFNLNTYFVNFDKETQENLFREIFGNKINQKNVVVVIFFSIISFFGMLYYVNRNREKDIYSQIKEVLLLLEKKSQIPREDNEAPLIYLERVQFLTNCNFEVYKNVLVLFNKCHFCANPVKSDFVTLKKEIKSLKKMNKQETL